MAHAEMDAIEIEDTPVLLQRTLAPGSELLLQITVQATDRADTGSHSQQRFGHCSYFVGACAGHEHVGQALGDLGFIAAVALEDLGVKLTLTVSRNLQVFDPTRGGHQITRVVAVAVSFALGATLSPADSDE